MPKISEKDDSRPVPILLASLPLVVMVLLLSVGYGLYRVRPQVLLVAAALFTGALAIAIGIKWPHLQEGIVSSIAKALPAILIMLCVGLLIAAWIAAGTVPMIIYYGLKLISPKYFLLTACLVCSLVSLATGTSWGTVGTLGVAFIGMAMAMDIPLGPAAGAIVAGAYFGDKLSPFSDVANLAPVAAGSNLFDHLRHTLWSALPAWAVGLLVYFLAGLKYGDRALRSSAMDLILATLRQHFTFHAVLLLPLVIVFYFAFTKKPVIPGMILSALVAAVLAVTMQGIPLTEVANALNSGFQPHTGVADVDRLLARGGLMSMMETQLIAFTAFCFGGIMQRSGFLDAILERVLRFTRSTWSVVATTVLATVVAALVTGSSYLAMIIPGELLAPVFIKRKLASKNLSRIIEECGAILVPLIPWSMAGVYISGTIGVPTLSYLPWAVMNYAAVAILLLFGFTGWTMAPRLREDETQAGS